MPPPADLDSHSRDAQDCIPCRQELPTLLTTCSRCGAQVAADAVYCSRCGNAVSGEVELSPASSSPTLVQELTPVPLTPGDLVTPLPEGQTLRRLAASVAVHYRVERELGRGGMATVFLAHDLKRDRDVAIKVLHPDLAASVGGDRFQREIQLAGQLQHPNILGLYDSGAADGLLYYVMPYVSGDTLRDRIDREGQLPIGDALRIFREVASALGFAHEKGIVHRDIKPENILFEGDTALVADFGIARTVMEGAQKLTQTGMVVGTPLYMSPEQASGEKVGPAADIYALGCLLYEMLAGEPPFTGKNAMAIMARHAREQVPSIRIVRPSVPEEVEACIWAAMEKNPSDRPRTCAKLVEILGMSASQAMMMTPTMMRRIPGATASSHAFRPWWKKPVAIAAMALVLLGGAGVVTWRATAGAKRATAAGDPSARRLAVLYFTDQSDGKKYEALANGLTEGLIASLGTIPSLTVISPGGVEKFRNSEVTEDSIARALRAGYIVRGEVAPDGAQVRVSLHLDDASGVTLSRASFTRPAANIIALRDTLTAAASDLIRRQLGEEFAVSSQRASTTSDAAWLLVQRGEQSRRAAEAAIGKGDSIAVQQRFNEADSLLAQAERADPKWAEPIVRRAMIAYRRARLVETNPGALRPWIGVGLGHAARAVALDPSDPDALEARGDLAYLAWLRGLEPEKVRADSVLQHAKADLESAVRLNPRQAGAYAMLSHLYYNSGTTTDVNIAAQRALEADEFLSNAETVLNRLFLSSYDLRQFDRAEQWCRETQRRFGAGVNAARCQLFMLTAGKGDIAKAWALADTVVARTPPAKQPFQRLNANMLVAAVIAKAAKAPGAPAILADSAKRVAQRSEGDPVLDQGRELAFYGGFVYATLGDVDDSIRLLKNYLAANPQRVPSMRDDPGWWYRDVSSDPRFKQLVGAQ